MTPRGRSRPAPPPRRGPSPGVIVPVAVAALAGILLVAFLVFSNGEERPAPPPAPPAAVAPKRLSKPKDPHKEVRNEANWWFEEKFLDYAGRVKTLTGKEVHALFAEAEKKGYPAIPGVDWDAKRGQVYERLIKREPDDPDANRYFGLFPLSDYPDFWKVFRHLTDAKVLPADLARFRDEWEGRIRWGPVWRTPALSKEEFARSSALLDRFVAMEEAFEKNPTKRAIFEALARVQLHPILGDYDTVHVEVPPFVLFYASKDLAVKTGSEDEKERIEKEKERLEVRLKAFTEVIQAYLAFFEKNWMTPLSLEAFRPRQLFFVWVFGDRKSFDRFGYRMGLDHPPGLLGYFNPRDRWVFLYEEKKDRVRTETSLIHELTHQLHWHFSKQEEGPFRNHFHRVGAIWFKEGWAEYIAWHTREGKDYTFAQDARPRVDNLRALRDAKLPLYPLRRLVRAESYRGYLGDVVKEWLPKRMGGPVDPAKKALVQGLYLEVLYGESWFLLKFLHEGLGGKYRKKALKFTEATLKGYLGYRGERGYARAHEVFAEIFGLKTKDDWTRFEKEFEDYLETKLR